MSKQISDTMVITGYLIEKYNCMNNAYTCNRLVEEADKLGIDLRIIGIHDTFITSDGIWNSGEKLEDRDFLINRYKWGRKKDEINTLVKKSYNSLESYNRYINKYEQIKRLHSTEFIIPQYLLGTAQTSYEIIATELGTPFVGKGLESSMGEEIVLIETKEQFEKLRNIYGNEKEWLFEEFVKTSFGRDIRFYSIRGEVVACMQRKSQSDFRANVALGASVEPYTITPAICTIARDIYKQTGLDFLGVDLLFGEVKPYFCEINVMPGIEGIETASGVNVARRIIETIKGDFEDE